MAFALATGTSVAIRTLEPLGGRFHRDRCRDIQIMRRKTRAKMRTSTPPPSSAPRALHDPSAARRKEEEGSFSVLASLSSRYNDIVVVDTPKSRVLLLDYTHNIHSLLNKEQKWTGSYWDDFAGLPAIVPQGPIAILGLGGGTAAHLMLEVWPSLQIEGWEIDEILIDISREYFGLSNLEKCTEAGGLLSVRIGDALSPSATVQGGFAGIIVDLFSDGKILPQLYEDKTWLELEKKLMPCGRIMVNCGGPDSEVSDSRDRTVNSSIPSNGSWVQNSTIKAMCRTFPGKGAHKDLRFNELMEAGSI